MRRNLAIAGSLVFLFGCSDTPDVADVASKTVDRPVPQRSDVPSTIDPRNLAALTAGSLRAADEVVPIEGVGLSSVIDPPSIITNGTIGLGVNPEGHLNFYSSVLSLGYGGGSGGTYAYGLRFLPTGAEATAPGCLCEGWGIGDMSTGLQGSANRDSQSPSVQNLVVESFTVTPSTAVSVVRAAGIYRVTHNYHPTTLTTYLYEVEVTIENISSAPRDVIYRRVMDWDVEPTPFNEYVTIQRGTATAIYRTDNNGFNAGNPFSFSSYGALNVNVVDNGPRDHGALFDFRFGILNPGQKVHFRTFYGAANNEANALLAIGAAQIEAYSLGQTSTDKIGGTPNTFIFGFGGIGGAPVEPPNQPPVIAAVPPVCGTTIPATMGGSVSFSVNASDPNAGNTVTLAALAKPATATFPTATGNPVSSTFNWLVNATGNHLVKISAKDNAGTEVLCNVTIAVPTNVAPVANAGVDQTASITTSPTVAVTLNGTASTDDGQIAPLTYTWKIGATTVGTGPTPTVNFPWGTHTVTLTVFDGQYSASDNVVIDVKMTFEGLCTMVKAFVTHHGVANSLCVKLNAAAASAARGSMNSQKQQLEAFINEVQSEAGGKIPSDKAPLLIAMAQSLMP